MKYLALCLLLAGCRTLIRDPNGVTLVDTNADFDQLTYSSAKVSATIVNHKPSVTIKAGGQAASEVITTAGAAAAALPFR